MIWIAHGQDHGSPTMPDSRTIVGDCREVLATLFGDE